MTVGLSEELRMLLEGRPNALLKAEAFAKEMSEGFAGRVGARQIATRQDPAPERKTYGLRERLGPLEEWIGEEAPRSEHVFRHYGWILSDFEVTEIGKRLAEAPERNCRSDAKLDLEIEKTLPEFGPMSEAPDIVLCGLAWLGEAYRIAKQHPNPTPREWVGEYRGMRVFVTTAIPDDTVFVYRKSRISFEADALPRLRVTVYGGDLAVEVLERFGVPNFDLSRVRTIRGRT